MSDLGTLRGRLEASGVETLLCDDFRAADIERWTDVPRYQRDLRRELDRAALGEVDYLTIRGPSGEPTCKCGIDYVQQSEGAVIYQFDTAAGLWGLGLGGRLLIGALTRAVSKGRRYAELGVELDNDRARSLYERNGFLRVRDENVSWEYDAEDGSTHIHRTTVAVLRRPLAV